MKIPVFCSLIPAELILHMGHEPYFIDADQLVACRANEYHCAFHENLCSYSKVLYDYLLKNHSGFGLIIIPTSCDALKKLYSALKMHIPSEKLYLLDVPQSKNEFAKEFMAAEFAKLAKRLTPSPQPSPRRGEGACPSPQPSPRRGEGACPSPRPSPQRGEGVRIGVFGSNVPLGVLEKSIAKFGFEAVFLNHCLTKSYPDEDLVSILKEDGIEKYAHSFLEKNSCPRTNDYKYKEALKGRIKEEEICALVVNVLKFCDFHPFDFRYFKNEMGPDFPALLIEHELTASSEGQVMTRLEAFFESIRKKVEKPKKGKARGRKGDYFVGVDSGSHATKLVCIDGSKNIISKEVVPTGTSVKKSAEMLIEKLGEVAKIRSGGIACIVATGYGRNEIDFADEVVTEISCHALGAHYMLRKAATIIDVGGQDSKAIKIDEDGGVVRFAMNDKCAAGTGRFLEVMAAKLQMSLPEFAEMAYGARSSIPISSMCSVFAESEVISLIASGKSKEEIAKGIHQAIAERTVALAKRIDPEPPYYMAGGVALNRGLVREMEAALGSEIIVLDEPQFSGALGAAIIALGGC